MHLCSDVTLLAAAVGIDNLKSLAVRHSMASPQLSVNYLYVEVDSIIKLLETIVPSCFRSQCALL